LDTPGRSLYRRASWPTVTHVGIGMPQESSDVVIVGALVLVGTASTPERGAGAVAVSRGYRGVMRVYELARELGITSATLVSQLRAEGEWVDSHRSSVPVPVQLRYLSVKGVLSPSLPAEAPRRDPNQWPAWSGPRVRWRRRPGPERIARYTTTNRDQLEQWNDLDPDLISTRDVAEYLKVQPATVRQWAKRGYIRPVGTIGPANLFSRRQVAAARTEIEARQRASGRRAQDRFSATRLPVDRVPAKFFDNAVTVGQAASLAGVAPSTIRSWIHRNHLKPLDVAGEHGTLLRLGVVVTAARNRVIPRPRGRSRVG